MSRNALVVAGTVALFVVAAWLLARQDADEAPPARRADAPARIPFPAGLPPAYRPEGFARAVDEAVAECPDAAMSVARVDCSEFPCVAWLGGEGIEALRTCAGWTTRFGAGPTATGWVMTDGGARAYAAVAPSPDGAVDPARFRDRLREGRAALTDAWGGRELTEDEQVDRTIEFLRHRGAPGDAERADALQAQRSRAPEPPRP